MSTKFLSAGDCKNILNNAEPHQRTTLQSYTLEPFCKELRGYLGKHLLLTLNIKTTDKKHNDQKINFFVKTLKCDGLLEALDGDLFYEKEIFVYKFFENVKKCVPKVNIDVIPKLFYHTSDKTFVLENLCERGYIGTKDMKLDKHHMYVAIEALAKFHAVTIAFEEYKKSQTGETYYITTDHDRLLRCAFFGDENASGYKYIKSAELAGLKLIELVTRDQTAITAFKEKFSKSVISHTKLVNNNNNYRKVLSHGDLWGFNMLFKYNNLNKPIDCKIIDFQLIRYAPPAHDITLLTYMASTRDMFKTNIFDYYNHYYRHLNTQLSLLNLDITTILPRDEFNATCKIYMKLSKFIWLCYRQTSEIKETVMAEIAKDKALFQSTIIGEGRAKVVEDNFNADSAYREHVSNILEDYKHALTHDHITVEDCFKVIESKIGSNNYTFIDYNVQCFDGKIGFLGEHYGLQINIEQNSQKDTINCFVKLLPSTISQQNFVINSGICYKELQFYNKIVPDMLKYNINIKTILPECYLAEFGYLIVDDVKKKNYVMKDIRKSLDLDTFKLGLVSLAKLHACGIIYEEKLLERMGKTVELIDIYKQEFTEAFYTDKQHSVDLLISGQKGIAEQIRMFSNHTTTITPEEFTNLANMFVDKYTELTKPSVKYRNTICHGDLWTNNILFNLQEKHAIIIDFQSYRYSPPAHDLMQFLYFTTDRDFRAKHQSDVLDFYYDSFKNIITEHECDIDKILTYTDFLKSCQHEKQFAIAQTVTHFHNILMTPERLEEFFKDDAFSHKAMFVDRSEHIRRTAAVDDVYSKRNQEALQDLRELCEQYATYYKS